MTQTTMRPSAAARALAVAGVLLLAMPVGLATAGPRGKGVRVRRTQVVKGLTHQTLRSRTRAIHIARIAAGSNLKVQPVPSRGNRTGRGPLLEPTSRLCRRVDCLVAVNGDFFRGGEPVGGVILDGQAIKPPRVNWRQANFDDQRNLTARPIKLRATIVTADLQRRRIVRIDKPRSSGLAMFTPSFGPRTPRGDTVEAVFRVRSPSGPVRIGQTSMVRMIALRSRGGTYIPRDGVVVSARGGAGQWLRDAWRARSEGSRDALLRLRADADVWDSLGGRPVLVRDGRSVVGGGGGSFAHGAHPRTMLGRTRDGATLLVTVDGRQRTRRGMSLRDAAGLMIRLGAVEAINLDGGGSTTFVKRGRVMNRPSDGRERPVAVALAVVRPRHGVDGPRAPRLGAFAVPAAPSPVTTGSPLPDAARPAIVAVVAEPPAGPPAPLTAAAGMAIVGVAMRLLHHRRGRRRGAIVGT